MKIHLFDLSIESYTTTLTPPIAFNDDLFNFLIHVRHTKKAQHSGNVTVGVRNS